MLYVTGDLHIPIDIAKLHPERFREQERMTKEDFVIVCGDFGGVWNNDAEELFWRQWLSERNFTTLFADGNHENFDLLNAYPVEEYCGGKVHRIADGVYHLMRGEVFDINGVKVFAMGGASSHDRERRTEGVSWWAEELPSDAEYENAERNLAANNYKVDYVITHCAADSLQNLISLHYPHDKLTDFLERIIKGQCDYTKWFFGHYHSDLQIDDKHRCLYDSVVRIC